HGVVRRDGLERVDAGRHLGMGRGELAAARVRIWSAVAHVARTGVRRDARPHRAVQRPHRRGGFAPPHPGGGGGGLAATHPRAGRGDTLAYDILRGHTVLFGGTDGTTGTATLTDTWEWDGTNWAQRLPAASPPPRQNSGMAYDLARGCTVLFAGMSLNHLGDT